MLRSRGALVRFGEPPEGPLGAFVSRDGLVVTTRAAVAGCLARAPGPVDLDSDGFVARSQDEEIRCPGVTLKTVEAPPAEGRILEDVRLVFVPERALADFGGPAARISYPRTSLDVVVLRAWEGDRPVRVARFLALSARGPVDGDPLWVAGQRFTDDRRVTPAQLEAERDAVLPFALARLQALAAALKPLADSPGEAGREARTQLRSVTLRAATIEASLEALRDPVRFAEAKRRHDRAILALNALAPERLSDADKDAAVRAFIRVEKAWKTAATSTPRVEALRGELAPHGVLWMRAAPGGDGNVAAASAGPVVPALEIERLAWGFDSVRLALPARDPAVAALLRGRSARARAEELVNGPPEALAQARLALEQATQDARDAHWRDVYGEIAAAGPAIDTALRALGPSAALQADGVVPVARAIVRGSAVDGRHVHWATGYGDLYAADRRAQGAAGQTLPERWRAALTRVDFSIPLDFTAELDVTSPFAGAALCSADGLAVGVIVGTNRAGVADGRLVPRGDGRVVAVASNGLLHALDRIYDAKHIVDELLSSAADR